MTGVPNPMEAFDQQLRQYLEVCAELAASRQRVAAVQPGSPPVPKDILDAVGRVTSALTNGGAVRLGGNYSKLRPIQAAFRYVRDHGEGHPVQEVQDECVRRGMRLKQERSFRTSLGMPDARNMFKREKDGKTPLQGKLFFTDEARAMVERGEEP